MVINELRSRGVEDILIAVIAGHKGFPEAIRTVFPETRVQVCIVHLMRFSLSFCGWKDRQVTSELSTIYRAEAVKTAASAGRVRSRSLEQAVPHDRPELLAQLGGKSFRSSSSRRRAVPKQASRALRWLW